MNISEKHKKQGDIKDKIPVLICEKTNLIVYLEKGKKYDIKELQERYKVEIYDDIKAPKRR